AGELREVVGGVQLGKRLAPSSAKREIVPVRDNIAERASLVAEGNAAVHTARRLLVELFVGKLQVDLDPVLFPLRYGPARRQLAMVFKEAFWIGHDLASVN